MQIIKSPVLWSAVLAIVVLGVAAAGVRARAMGPVREERSEITPTISAPTLLEIEDLPPYVEAQGEGLTRLSDVHTIIPTRTRLGLLKYQVQQGDTLFAIADNLDWSPNRSCGETGTSWMATLISSRPDKTSISCQSTGRSISGQRARG